MAARLPIHIVNSAARAIIEAAEWWGTNRAKAPDAFSEELKRAFQLIAAHPRIGARALNVKLRDVRRVHLARVHYHLYYRVVADPPSIEVPHCGKPVGDLFHLWRTLRNFNEPN